MSMLLNVISSAGITYIFNIALTYVFTNLPLVYTCMYITNKSEIIFKYVKIYFGAYCLSGT